MRHLGRRNATIPTAIDEEAETSMPPRQDPQSLVAILLPGTLLEASEFERDAAHGSKGVTQSEIPMKLPTATIYQQAILTMFTFGGIACSATFGGIACSATEPSDDWGREPELGDSWLRSHARDAEDQQDHDALDPGLGKSMPSTTDAGAADEGSGSEVSEGTETQATPDVNLSPSAGSSDSEAANEASESELSEPCENQDTDGDGLHDCEEFDRGLSAKLVDTDGDGFTDYEEVHDSGGFGVEGAGFDSTALLHPLVADTARIHLTLEHNPLIAVSYRDQATGEEQWLDTLAALEPGEAEHDTDSGYYGGPDDSIAAQIEASHTEFLLGARSTNAPLHYTHSLAIHNQPLAVWLPLQWASHERVLSWAQADEAPKIDRAVFAASVRLSNFDLRPLELSELELAVTAFDPREPQRQTDAVRLRLLSEGSLPSLPQWQTLADDCESLEGRGPTELGHGAEEILTFAGLLSPSQALSLLGARYGLALTPIPSTEAEESEEGSARDGTASLGWKEGSELLARTAEIILDYGPELPIEAYRLAVDDDGGQRAGDILDYLGVDYTIGHNFWQEVGDAPAIMTSGTGLTSLRDTSVNVENGGTFLIAVTTRARSAEPQTSIYNPHLSPFDFANLRVHNGDTLHIVYAEDRDRDGLAARTEMQLGTSDLHSDTDGDDLLDWQEMDGWDMPCDGATTTAVYPDPRFEDTDGDGVSDWHERSSCTDPAEALLLGQ